MKILILGAGPIGTAYANLLASKVNEITILEKRKEQECYTPQGRSVNLVLTKKAWTLLDRIGLKEEVKGIVVPMKGRLIHALNKQAFFQQYGRPGQTLDSVSRFTLNSKMIQKTKQWKNVNLLFGNGHKNLNVEEQELETDTLPISVKEFDVVIAADGVNSGIRTSLQEKKCITGERNYLNYGYIEFEIPAKQGNYVFEKEFLHIWPLGKLMVIALPNPEGSFTGGVFAPITGENSFQEIEEIGAEKFFTENFREVTAKVPSMVEQYSKKTPTQLSEVRCYPWHYKNTILVGDAAHAITPFLGQGMNFGMLLAMKLSDLLIRKDATALSSFFSLVKPEADLVANWSLENFNEMCSTDDCDLQLRKEIEKKLAEEYPERFACFHSMVSFCDLSYSEIKTELERQNAAWKKIMQIPNIHSKWQTYSWEEIKRGLLCPTAGFFKGNLVA